MAMRIIRLIVASVGPVERPTTRVPGPKGARVAGSKKFTSLASTRNRPALATKIVCGLSPVTALSIAASCADVSAIRLPDDSR